MNIKGKKKKKKLLELPPNLQKISLLESKSQNWNKPFIYLFFKFLLIVELTHLSLSFLNSSNLNSLKDCVHDFKDLPTLYQHDLLCTFIAHVMFFPLFPFFSPRSKLAIKITPIFFNKLIKLVLAIHQIPYCQTNKVFSILYLIAILVLSIANLY